jgi:large subunit ribosomal protein L24
MQTARPVTKPTKQRKMLYQAPDHVRHRLLAAHLSPELRATHIAKSLPVRSGDTIRVMRGDHKGTEGKITRIDLKKYRIYVEGLTREKVDGTTIFVPVHPSKLMITRLNLDDKWRKKILERKQKAQKKPQKPTKKPKPEPVEKPPETAELKQPAEEKVTEEKVTEEKVTEEKVTEEKVTEEKVTEEKVAAAIERAPKKGVSKPRKKTKKAAAEKKEAQAAETKAEKEPKVQRKRTKRKSAKKTEEGEG